MTRKELTTDIKKRVAAGESKRAIFSRYSMTEWEDAASRILPLQVTLAKRKRWRFLNWALVGCLSVITMFKAIDIIFMTGNLNNAGARIGIVLFGLAINVAVLVANLFGVQLPPLFLFYFMDASDGKMACHMLEIEDEAA